MLNTAFWKLIISVLNPLVTKEMFYDPVERGVWMALKLWSSIPLRPSLIPTIPDHTLTPWQCHTCSSQMENFHYEGCTSLTLKSLLLEKLTYLIASCPPPILRKWSRWLFLFLSFSLSCIPNEYVSKQFVIVKKALYEHLINWECCCWKKRDDEYIKGY